MKQAPQVDNKQPAALVGLAAVSPGRRALALTNSLLLHLPFAAAAPAHPPQVTIYTELAWLTHTGDDREAASRKMAAALAAKLNSSHTDLDARLKTLLTVKQVASKGSTEFRLHMKAYKDLVKEHTSAWRSGKKAAA